MLLLLGLSSLLLPGLPGLYSGLGGVLLLLRLRTGDGLMEKEGNLVILGGGCLLGSGLMEKLRLRRTPLCEPFGAGGTAPCWLMTGGYLMSTTLFTM